MQAFSAVWCETKRDLAKSACKLCWQGFLPRFVQHLYAKPNGRLFKEINTLVIGTEGQKGKVGGGGFLPDKGLHVWNVW